MENTTPDTAQIFIAFLISQNQSLKIKRYKVKSTLPYN